MQKIFTYSFKLIFFLLLLNFTASNYLQAQQISTISGFYPLYGNGLFRLKTALHPCYGLAADAQGNLIFSEAYNQIVHKIDTAGIITIIAGIRQEKGFDGDNKLATEALLNNPYGVAIDQYNNVYIADKKNNAVRKIDKDGIIHTIAGNGIAGFSGDGGLGINASLNDPFDVAADSKGNVYISDNGNKRIRKVDVNGIITTYAGTGETYFNKDNIKATHAALDPQGLATDKYDNLFVADYVNQRIRKINVNNVISTYAGNGTSGTICQNGLSNDSTTATAIGISHPSDVCISDKGEIFFITKNCSILSVDVSGKIHLLQNGSSRITNLTYSNGNIYFNSNYEPDCFPEVSIYRLHIASHRIFTFCGGSYHKYAEPEYFEGKAAGLTALNKPALLCFKKDVLYFTELDSIKVKSINNKGILSTIAGNGKQGSEGYGDGGKAINAEFRSVTGVAADNTGNIYIADDGDNRIRKINSKGVISTFAILNIHDIVTDENDNIYASSYDTIYKFNTAGIKTIYASGLHGVSRLCIDKQHNLYFSNFTQHVKKIDASGNVTVVAGNGANGFSGDGGLAINASFSNPYGIITDANNNLYIADNGNNRIRKVNAAGIITTLAGGGMGDYFYCQGYGYYGSFSGDGDSAQRANLWAPYDVVVTENNNLLFSDERNNKIRQVQFDCIKKPVAFSYANKQYINRTMQINYDCKLLCKIEPAKTYVTALNGNTTTNVWVEKKTIKDSANKPYVLRHYQIFPERKSRVAATARLTLYFTQNEFDAYNTTAGNEYLKLPSSANDSGEISNLMVYSFKAKSKKSSGLPGTYDAEQITINPPDKNIVWNNKGKYWEVSFDVDALGGFFIGTEKINTVAHKEELQIKESGIKVYPNPATDKVYITVPSNLLYSKIILCDANGKIVNSMIANAENSYFKLNNLATGIYYLKFDDGTVKKVVHSK